MQMWTVPLRCPKEESAEREAIELDKNDVLITGQTKVERLPTAETSYSALWQETEGCGGSGGTIRCSLWPEQKVFLGED